MNQLLIEGWCGSLDTSRVVRPNLCVRDLLLLWLPG